MTRTGSTAQTDTLDLAGFVAAHLSGVQRRVERARTQLFDTLGETGGAVQAAEWRMAGAVKAETLLRLMPPADELAQTDDERRAVRLAEAVARVVANGHGRFTGDLFTSASWAAQAEAGRELAGLLLGLGLMDAATFAARVAL